MTTTPWPLIRKLMQKSWLKFATQKAAHRKETAGELNFNRALTGGVVAKLPIEIQHIACLQIAGGYQFETRKTKWIPDHDGICPLCGLIAPFRHTLFQCEKMYEVYEAEGRSDLPCDQDDPIWRVPIIRENELVPAKELFHFGLADNAAIPVPDRARVHKLLYRWVRGFPNRLGREIVCMEHSHVPRKPCTVR